MHAGGGPRRGYSSPAQRPATSRDAQPPSWAALSPRGVRILTDPRKQSRRPPSRAGAPEVRRRRSRPLAKPRHPADVGEHFHFLGRRRGGAGRVVLRDLAHRRDGIRHRRHRRGLDGRPDRVRAAWPGSGRTGCDDGTWSLLRRPAYLRNPSDAGHPAADPGTRTSRAGRRRGHLQGGDVVLRSGLDGAGPRDVVEPPATADGSLPSSRRTASASAARPPADVADRRLRDRLAVRRRRCRLPREPGVPGATTQYRRGRCPPRAPFMADLAEGWHWLRGPPDGAGSPWSPCACGNPAAHALLRARPRSSPRARLGGASAMGLHLGGMGSPGRSQERLVALQVEAATAACRRGPADPPDRAAATRAGVLPLGGADRGEMALVVFRVRGVVWSSSMFHIDHSGADPRPTRCARRKVDSYDMLYLPSSSCRWAIWVAGPLSTSSVGFTLRRWSARQSWAGRLRGRPDRARAELAAPMREDPGRRRLSRPGRGDRRA